MNRKPPFTGTGVSNERWFLCALAWTMVAATNSVAEPQPSHQGKPASYWLDQIYSTNANGMKESIEAFTSMGSNAVPFLVEVLEQKPSKLGGIVDEKLSDYRFRQNVPEGLVKALPSADRVEQRRESAAFLISQIGPHVVDTNGIATPTEQKDFENPAARFFRSSASVSLWRLGLEKEAPTLSIVAELKQRAGSDEIAYVELLGEIGSEARLALPLLMKFLDSNGTLILRRAAAVAIRKIDPDEAARLGLPALLAVP